MVARSFIYFFVVFVVFWRQLLATLLRYTLCAINGAADVTSWRSPAQTKPNVSHAGWIGSGRGRGRVRLASLLCECDDSLTSVTLMCFRFLFYAQLVLASFSFVLLRFLCNKDNKETGRQGEAEGASETAWRFYAKLICRSCLSALPPLPFPSLCILNFLFMLF